MKNSEKVWNLINTFHLPTNPIICQNCGKELLKVGEDIRMIISDINYECSCGSCGLIKGIITDFKSLPTRARKSGKKGKK